MLKKASVSLCLAIAASCLAAAIATDEESWIESTEPALNPNKDPALGSTGPSSTPETMASKRKQFLMSKLNHVRASCNRAVPLGTIKELTVHNVTKQIVEGTKYVADLTIVDDQDQSIDKEVTFLRLLPEDDHPHHFVKNHGKGDIEDLFHLISIEPHPCGTDTAVLTDETPEQIAAKYSTGLVMPKEPLEYIEPTVTAEELARLPAEFDWRDEIKTRYGDDAAAATPLNQGSCGSCWAFGAATAAGYRTVIASKGQYNVVPSTQVGMSCATNNPCGGGWFNMFYDTMRDNSIPANQFVAYTGQPGQCSVSHNSIDIKGGTSSAIKGVDAMMNELYTNGPFGLAIDAGHSAFGGYKSGVADGASSGLNHAVVALGWGTENGKPYWLVQNSWGAGWGANGFIKVARGNNALNMEAHGAQPNYMSHDQMSCKSNPPCKNGGAFKKDCSCQCADGYSGAQCDSCQKTCNGAQFSGSASITGGSCQCQCTAGFVTPTNLLGYADCALKMEVGASTDAMVKVASGASVAVAFSVVGSAPSDAIQNVKKGDMFVAVKAGEQPWTHDGGWNTDIKADVCGAKAWPAQPCGTSNPSIKFTTDGVYEIFLVKYLGQSEFGADKGYGSDFMSLPQRVCVGSADCNNVPAPTPPAPTPPAPTPPTPAPAPTPASCNDKSSQCPGWGASYCGAAKVNPGSVPFEEYCCATCTPKTCESKHSNCASWGSKYCGTGSSVNGENYDTFCCAQCTGLLVELDASESSWEEGVKLTASN